MLPGFSSGPFRELIIAKIISATFMGSMIIPMAIIFLLCFSSLETSARCFLGSRQASWKRRSPLFSFIFLPNVTDQTRSGE